jgi:adenine-specific DNA glycosylase
LAGQWEFPSVCVWTSDDQTLERGQPRKDMSTQVPVVDRSERSKALTQFLEELSPRTGVVDARERYQLEVPIEHIFSHVRHTMWIEVALSQQADNDEAQLQWISPGGKEVRWMSDSDMKLVGVTSGVKRIIKTVNQKKTTGISLKSKKRKR